MASSMLKSQFCFLLFILTTYLIKAQAEFDSSEELEFDTFNMYEDLELDTFDMYEERDEAAMLEMYGDLEDDTDDYCDPSPEDEAHCVWYGKCVLEDGSNKTVPCADSCKGRPVVGNSTKWNMLKMYCEDFLTPMEGEELPRVCCSLRTIAMLNVQLASYEGLLNRCPSCWSNYRKFYCTLNCAPNQSDYMIVTEKAPAHFKSVQSKLE